MICTHNIWEYINVKEKKRKSRKYFSLIEYEEKMAA